MFAAKRAAVRLSGERLAVEAGAEGGGFDEARLALQEATRLANVSSQVGSQRPIQGAAVSPDSGTLATADWAGIVSFWSLEDNVRRLKTVQARARAADIPVR